MSLILLLIWGCLAIYFSNLPWRPLQIMLAATFAGFGVWACWISGTEKLREISHVNPLAAEGIESDLSSRIRKGLPNPPTH